MNEDRTGAFGQGAAFSGPGADADLRQRLGLAQRGAAEHGTPREELHQARRASGRAVLQPEQAPPLAEISDGRAYPVSPNIAVPQLPVHSAPHNTDRLQTRLDDLAHRLDMVEGRLDLLIEHLLPEGP